MATVESNKRTTGRKSVLVALASAFTIAFLVSVTGCGNPVGPDGSSSDIVVDMKPGTYTVEKQVYREVLKNLTALTTLESFTIKENLEVSVNYRFDVTGSYQVEGDYVAVSVYFTEEHLASISGKDDTGKNYTILRRTGIAEAGGTVVPGTPGYAAFVFGPISPSLTSFTYTNSYENSSLKVTFRAVAVKLSAPVIAPEASDISDTYPVGISELVEGASIACTIDGSDPKLEAGVITNGFRFSSPFTLPRSPAPVQVKALAFKTGWTDSSMTSSSFNVSKTLERMAGDNLDSRIYDGVKANETSVWPRGLALDSSGNFFVSDARDAVRKINLSTGIMNTYVAAVSSPAFAGDGGLARSANVSSPRGLALDASGNLYIADKGNECVRKVDHSTLIISTAVGRGPSKDENVLARDAWISVTDVDFDSAGRLYFVGPEVVRRVDFSTGRVTTVAGTRAQGFSGDGGPALAAQFEDASAIAINAAGELFVSDTGNNRIRKIDNSGIITTFAGTGEAAFSGDGGFAVNAALNKPAGIVFGPDGSLYVADKGNGRVRKIDALTGIMSSVAGAYNPARSSFGRPLANYRLIEPNEVLVAADGNIYIACEAEIVKLKE